MMRHHGFSAPWHYIALLGISLLLACQLEPYLGNWKITGTVSGNDPMELTGTGITYTREYIRFGEKEYRDIYFERNAVQHKNFFQKYRIAPDKLGLSGTYSLEVSVMHGDRKLSDRGTFFIIRDMDTLIIPLSGEFYILQRADR
jgi:hypothetical protein